MNYSRFADGPLALCEDRWGFLTGKIEVDRSCSVLIQVKGNGVALAAMELCKLHSHHQDETG